MNYQRIFEESTKGTKETISGINTPINEVKEIIELIEQGKEDLGDFGELEEFEDVWVRVTHESGDYDGEEWNIDIDFEVHFGWLAFEQLKLTATAPKCNERTISYYSETRDDPACGEYEVSVDVENIELEEVEFCNDEQEKLLERLATALGWRMEEITDKVFEEADYKYSGRCSW